MADNVTLNPGTGGAVVAADDVGGVLFQRVKVTFGSDGAAQDVTSSEPLPVTLGLTNAQLRASPLDVDTGLVQPLTDAQLRASAELEPVLSWAAVAARPSLEFRRSKWA